MEDRNKGKGTMEYTNNDWPPQSAWRRTAIREVARVPAPYGREDGSNRSAGALGALQLRENPGRNAPVGNERPGVVLGAGGSTPRHGLHQLQVQAPHGPGIRPPPPMMCPACRYSFFFDNTICVYCACAAAAAAAENASTGHQQGDEAPAFQNMSPGLQQPPQAQWGSVPDDDQRCPACRFFPGRMADRPCRHLCRCNVCRFFLARVCLVCVFQHAAVVPARSSSSPGTWENKLPAAARWESPEGPTPPNTGTMAFSRQSRRNQCSQATSPLERIAKPVHDDGWCPTCHYTRAPTVFQPRTHDCLCDNCIKLDGIVCPVCANFGRGDSTSWPAHRKDPFDSV